MPQALKTGKEVAACGLGDLLYTGAVAKVYEPKDAVHRAATEAGYRSRAALKLRELDRKFKLLTPGMRVLDLGCWPGGWLQVAAEVVGAKGAVFGVDARAPDKLSLPNVQVLVADLLSEAAVDDVAAAIGGHVDLVLSDLAPKLSGIKDADRARHLALCERVVRYCDQFLKVGGRCVVKVFSDSESEVTQMLRARFSRVVAHRPATTRRGSSEIYAVGNGYSPQKRPA